MARQALQSDPASKRLFSHPRVAADLVRLLGDPWVDDLDLDRLERLPTEYVSDDLRARRADLPWWAPFKPDAGQPAGTGVMFHIEFQSSPDAHMAERLLEYVALLPRALRRTGWMAAEGGRVVAHVPLVVYNGRAKWNVPRQLDERRWAPSELRTLQPRLAYRLIDAKDYAGDDVADGNLARAVLALDAASAQGLAPALERAVALLSALDDSELWRSFVAWCGGTLSPRLGGQLPTLVNDKETTMLAETLREWDEQKIAEGRREGRLVGRQEGRRVGHREGRREALAEARALLCSQAARRFGAATGTELEAVLAGAEDASELARIGALIIDCDSGPDFLARARLR